MKGSALAVSQRLGGAVLGLVFQFLLARRLGAADTGTFFLAFQVANVMAILCRGGLELAAVRFTASRIAIGDFEGARGVYDRVFRRAVVLSLIGTAICAVLAVPLAEHGFKKPPAATPIFVMAFCIAPIVLYRLHGETLRGLGRVALSQFLINLAVPLVAILVALGLRALDRFALTSALITQILAHTLTAAVGIYAVREAFGGMPNKRRSPFDFGELTRAYAPLYQLSVLNLIQSSIPTLVLFKFRTDSEVGIYGVCQAAAMFLQLILLGHNAILGPEFAALHTRGDRAAIETLARSATKRMTLEALPIFLAFVILPIPVLHLFGGDFEAGDNCLRILAVGQLVNVATGSVGLLLVMSGHERAFRNSVVWALVCNVVLNVVLAPRFGIEGAAIATALGVILQNVIAAVMVKTRLGFFASPL